jgi:hypothetical protein
MRIVSRRSHGVELPAEIASTISLRATSRQGIAHTYSIRAKKGLPQEAERSHPVNGLDPSARAVRLATSACSARHFVIVEPSDIVANR